jgi:hypothetical protein
MTSYPRWAVNTPELNCVAVDDKCSRVWVRAWAAAHTDVRKLHCQEIALRIAIQRDGEFTHIVY